MVDVKTLNEMSVTSRSKSSSRTPRAIGRPCTMLFEVISSQNQSTDLLRDICFVLVLVYMIICKNGCPGQRVTHWKSHG
jgi:hypothetical protein